MLVNKGNLPLVTILINNYNYGRFLGQAIGSALSQTYPYIEVIVVDDGSTDNSHEIINSYGSRIITVLKSNGGQASAFNAGAAASNGNLLFFLDADDLFHPQKVEKIVNLFDLIGINSPAMIFHLLEAVDEDRRLLEFTLPSRSDKGLRELRDNERIDTELLSKISSSASAYEYATKYCYIPYLSSPTSGFVITRSLAKRLFPLPQEGILTCADDFIVKPAALLGDIYKANLTLGQYRIHGKNSWYGSTKPRSQLFLSSLDTFLNSKLEQEHKKPVFDHFQSMVARDYYRDHYGYRGCHSQLFEIAFKTVFRHADLRTCKFFIKTILIAIKSYFHSLPRSISYEVNNGSR